MHDNRDPTKHKCKTKVEDIVSVILAIAISVTALGLLGSIFKPGDSGGGFVKLEGSGSVTVGGLVDKEEDNTDNTTPDTDNNGADTDTDTGEGTDTEGDDTNADTDTTPGEDTEDNKDTIPTDETLLYNFSTSTNGLSYSENIDTYDYLWANTVKLDNEPVLEVGKNQYSASSEVVWLELYEDTENNTYVFETDFMWSGCKNGVSGETDPTWYYRFSLANASGAGNTDFLNLWFCSQTNEDVFAIVNSTKATTSDYLTVLNTNQWYKLMIKYNTVTDSATIFIDGTAVGFANSVSPDMDDVCGAFEIENRGKVRDSIIYIDNVRFSTTNE